MTFWNENPGKPTKRLWKCFVCGSDFECYEMYSDHIRLQHEEGREYITCPVASCKSPVRDLRAHFKAKHPNRVIPKTGQMRALIWRDFKTGKKGKKIAIKEGFFESAKMGGAKLHFRSGYEEEVYKCLEQDDDVDEYFVEPVQIPYFFNNEWHNYIPDLKVKFASGATELWEVKPKVQVSYAQNQEKFKSARKYADNMGWNFCTITEPEIAVLKTKVAQKKR